MDGALPVLAQGLFPTLPSIKHFFGIVLSGPGMLPEGLTPVLVSACEVKIDESHLKRGTRPALQPLSLS